MTINVFITDDHPLAVTGIVNMLAPFKHIAVTGTFHRGLALLDALKEQQPDVLLMDILLPDINGKELAAKIIPLYPAVRIVAITSLDAPTHVKAMMRTGCAGYVLKDTDSASLVQAIETVYAGNEYIEQSLKEQIADNLLNFKKRHVDAAGIQPKPRLTRREKEVLDLLVKEQTNQEMAEQLCLSIRTIENHRLNLLRKLQARTAVGLIKTAMEMGLI